VDAYVDSKVVACFNFWILLLSTEDSLFAGVFMGDRSNVLVKLLIISVHGLVAFLLGLKQTFDFFGCAQFRLLPM
jgi:hypothetical protein